MPRTGPDWSSYGRLERLFAQYDIAELSARLSGYMTPHREGKWVFREGFEYGAVNWFFDGSGSGDDQGLTAEYAKVGGYSVLLMTGSEKNSQAYMGRDFALPVTGHCGYEFAWAGDGSPMYVDVLISHYLSKRYRRFGMRIDTESEKLQSRKYDGTWEDFETSVYVPNEVDAWNVCKLVLDFDTFAYERFLLNGVEYPITTIQTSMAEVYNEAFVLFYVYVTTRDDSKASVYVDEVIVTENERGW